MAVKEYRIRGTVKAERVEEGQNVVTVLGARWVNEGDYLIYESNGGVSVVEAEGFEKRFVELKGDSEFHPTGHTVDQVQDFMRLNPDQVERIKDEESTGGKRKGVLEFLPVSLDENEENSGEE